MYTAYYGFKEKPFNIVSDPGFLYLSAKHRMALNYLEYGLMDGIGFILLTGEIGTGKTTLIKRLVQKIQGDLEIAVVFNTNVTAEELLELILDELEQERPEGGKASYIDVLNQYLISKHGQKQRVLLVVDEAQNLSQDALEEIRMLSNLQTDKQSLIQILLVGQPNLRDRLQHPSLSQLSQRIAVSYHLRPLDLEETKNYINHRLKISGGDNDRLFPDEAVKKIFDHTGGVPRSINILCDAALVYGFADELDTIDASVIDSVVKDRKEMGSVGIVAAPEKEKVAVGEVEGNGSLAHRIEVLEQQVYRLAATVEWQTGKLETRAESYKDMLVERLEAMLQKERSRADQLLAQCNIMEARLQLKRRQTQQSKAKKLGARTEPPSASIHRRAENDQDKEGDDRPGRFRKWFGK